ncbi:MAG TPA: sialidase [Gammaproteobacteria bacterium]|nr:sialidase [Gammaproteobacteria bacterium]
MSSWVAASTALLGGGPRRLRHPAIIDDGFVFEHSAHGMSHASTLCVSQGRLVAAWFGGSLESRPDVSILVSLNEGDGWSPPREVANGVQPGGERLACWNPVLFQPSGGPLLLFYKVGARPKTWWGMCMRSADGGLSWSEPWRLPEGVLGPIKNKPVELAAGELLSPSSIEHQGWRVHLERSRDLGVSWERIEPLDSDRPLQAIQPSVLRYADGRLQLLCRSKHGRLAESWSLDGGDRWSALELTVLPNPNSGTDAVSLADGRQLLVYNRSKRRRSKLGIALSRDGRRWRDVLQLEGGAGEYSYPAVIQAPDGLVHLSYSWNLSRIRHVVVDPARL